MGRIGLYWHGLTPFGRFMHLVLAIGILVLIAFRLMVVPAQADGVEGTGGYKDVVREYRYRQPVAYRRGDVRDYLTAAERRELRRIHTRAVARRDGHNMLNRRELAQYDRPKSRRIALYRDEPTRIRYVERRNAPSSLYSRVDDKVCRPAIKAVSEERGWQARALGNAIDKWRAAAIAEHGYSFGQYNNSRADRPDCGPIRTNKFGKDIWICSVRARPCRAL